MTLAERIFEVIREKADLETAFENRVLKILNVTDQYVWPFEDYSFDEYDSSFELKECSTDLKLSEEQQKEFWELGFQRCWLTYTDETERYYCPEFPQGELKKNRFDKK